MNISYTGLLRTGLDCIASGSYIEEANTRAAAYLTDGEYLDGASLWHIHLTGGAYAKMPNMTNKYEKIRMIEIYSRTSEDRNVGRIYLYNEAGNNGTSEPSPFTISTGSTATATYTLDITIDPSIDPVWRVNPWNGGPLFHGLGNIAEKIGFNVYYFTSYGIYGNGNTMDSGGPEMWDCEYPVTVYPYDTPPTLSAFTMNRADEYENISQQGEYGRYDITSNLAAILASDEPQFIKDNTALTLSFTRNGSTVSHAAESDGIGLLQSGGAALQLGNEETFTVTATLTDGINTVSMSALLSANFAIFNANAEKTGISFGKYATQSGFDCNMNAEFRGSTVFDADDVNDSIHHTFNSIPFIVPNMMECLWRKASPAASMGGNSTFTLSRELTAGEPVLLVYRMWEATDAFANIQTVIGWAGHAVRLFCLATSTTNRNGARPITIGPRGSYDASTVYFGNCEYNGSNNNNYCVLLAVYAFKREWLNHDDALEEYETANNL